MLQWKRIGKAGDQKENTDPDIMIMPSYCSAERTEDKSNTQSTCSRNKGYFISVSRKEMYCVLRTP